MRSTSPTPPQQKEKRIVVQLNKLRDLTKDGVAKLKIFNKRLISRDSNESENCIAELNTLQSIDQRPLAEGDALFIEIESFISRANQTIDFTKRASSAKHAKFNPLIVGDKINQWRAKRKGNELHESYDTLLIKAENIETGLKNITEQSLTDTSSMLIQAVHLKNRLNGCITHNSLELAKIQPFFKAIEDYLQQIRNTQADIQEMLDFVDEVSMLQDAAENGAFVPWAMRHADGAEIKVIPLKRGVLEKRLFRISTVSCL